MDVGYGAGIVVNLVEDNHGGVDRQFGDPEPADQVRCEGRVSWVSVHRLTEPMSSRTEVRNPSPSRKA